jgi:multiple antibiotic resistance protein
MTHPVRIGSPRCYAVGPMESVGILIKFFALAFGALLPVINPLGSALLFLSLIDDAPATVVRTLSRKIAINTVFFLLVIQLVGTAMLAFFGISLPVMQVAGGLVLAAMGWKLLNQEDSARPRNIDQAHKPSADLGQFTSKLFYPFTFPITAGPGTIVVLLTLSAHASARGLLPDALSHLGIFMAVIAVCVLVYISYIYAREITSRVAPQTAQGILRVIAFVLLCIGVQITWNGLQAMLKTVLR